MALNAPHNRIIRPLKTLPNMPARQSSDAGVQEYGKLFFQRYLFGVTVTQRTKFGNDCLENLKADTKFATNSTWVASEKLLHPRRACECRGMVWFFVVVLMQVRQHRIEKKRDNECDVTADVASKLLSFGIHICTMKKEENKRIVE